MSVMFQKDLVVCPLPTAADLNPPQTLFLWTSVMGQDIVACLPTGEGLLVPGKVY